MGLNACHCRLLSIAALSDYSGLDAAIQRIEDFDWLIFTSRNGIKFFKQRLVATGRDIRCLHGLKVASIGPRTAEAVEEIGLRNDLCPKDYTQEGLIEALKKAGIKGKNILIVRASQARDVLPEGLGLSGARVRVAPAYRTVLRSEKITEQGYLKGFDLITFTSSSCVEGFFKVFSSGQIFSKKNRFKVASIGPVTSQTCRHYGLKVDIEAKNIPLRGFQTQSSRHIKDDMISITKLLCDLPSWGDKLRYRPDMESSGRRPIVVWNVSRRCNLSCIHCYSNSSNSEYANELTTDEAKKMIVDLAQFNVPVLLFSGGEPLMRPDLFELNEFAHSHHIRTVISTNGTLITKGMAAKIKDAAIDYVGISLDGIGSRNDAFRGRRGAFELALQGIRNLVAVKQKVGLRFTITRHNYPDIGGIFQLVEDEAIDRVCFYHLVYTGRGSSMAKDDLSRDDMRHCIDSICDWAEDMFKRGIRKEVLTVDNHADAIYVYLRALKTNPQKAEKILQFLQYNKRQCLRHRNSQY